MSLQNIFATYQKAWPLSMLVRHVLETATDYTSAVSFLTSAPLIAPVYIIVAGSDEGQVRLPPHFAPPLLLPISCQSSTA